MQSCGGSAPAAVCTTRVVRRLRRCVDHRHRSAGVSAIPSSPGVRRPEALRRAGALRQQPALHQRTGRAPERPMSAPRALTGDALYAPSASRVLPQPCLEYHAGRRGAATRAVARPCVFSWRAFDSRGRPPAAGLPLPPRLAVEPQQRTGCAHEGRTQDACAPTQAGVACQRTSDGPDVCVTPSPVASPHAPQASRGGPRTGGPAESHGRRAPGRAEGDGFRFAGRKVRGHLGDAVLREAVRCVRRGHSMPVCAAKRPGCVCRVRA